MSPKKSVIIIGAGIAGLSAGVYAQLNGYQSRIYEMHSLPGGLMTAWKRKGYVIDGCIHWLTGSSPAYAAYYRWWQEIGLIQDRPMFDPEVFSRIEGRDGKVLILYADVNRLEKHLLELAPEDSKTIRDVCRAVRAFASVQPPEDGNPLKNMFSSLKLLPAMPYFAKWGRATMKDFANMFQNPFLRESFGEMWFPDMSAMGLFFTLAMLHKKSAGYPLGGSLPMAHAVEKRYCSLGGQIFYNARVDKILVENGRAVGIRLTDGREERADIVISAADGHATLYNMLDGKYITEEFQTLFDKAAIFPPILYIGLGVNRTFTDEQACTAGISVQLPEPMTIGGQEVKRLDVMIYNFDPTLAPQGKTSINVMVPASYAYWKELYGDGSDRERYEAEKQKIALEVINRLDVRFPSLAQQVEMADVATPLTFERFTGNWQGSFEGWLPTPQLVTKSISKSIPGLDNFYMVGQWVQAGGGLPSGVMTGREVVKKICKVDGKKFEARI